MCEQAKEKASDDMCTYFKSRSVNPTPLQTAIAQNIMDIEDLVTKGKAINECPYYASRGALPSADIVFAPYNYIIDVAIRESMSLNDHIRGSILIIDESHNIESVARDAASFERLAFVVRFRVIKINPLSRKFACPKKCRSKDMLLGAAREFGALSRQSTFFPSFSFCARLVFFFF